MRAIKFLTLAFVFYSICTNIHGQIIFSDKEPFEDTYVISNLYNSTINLKDSFSNLNINTNKCEILEIQDKKFLLIDGRLDLFEWKNKSWENISKSKYHGYNFLSKKFVYKNQIYTYGGYGFWKMHGDLLKYDWNTNEWEVQIIKAEKDYGLGSSFLLDSSLYILKPQIINQGINANEIKNCVVCINLNTLNSNELKLCHNETNFNLSLGLETDHYYLNSFDPTVIIDKNNFQFRESKLTYFKELFRLKNNSFIRIAKDSIFFFASPNDSTSVNFDLSNDYNNIQSNSLKLFRESDVYRNYSIVFIILLLTLLILYFRKRKYNHLTYKNEIIIKIKNLDQRIYTVEDLDILFDIHKIQSPENLRSKRASMIKNINLEYMSKNGKNLITREADTEDNRRNNYRIDDGLFT